MHPATIMPIISPILGVCRDWEASPWEGRPLLDSESGRTEFCTVSFYQMRVTIPVWTAAFRLWMRIAEALATSIETS